MISIQNEKINNNRILYIELKSGVYYNNHAMIIRPKLIEEINQRDVISRDHLFAMISKHYESANRSYSYRIISELVRKGYLFKLDSSTYSTRAKKEFSYELTYPEIESYTSGYGDYVIWDSNIFNKWVNHLRSGVITFIEVDKNLMNFVFDSLKNKTSQRILLNPNKSEFIKYYDDRLLIIKPINQSFVMPNHKISLEGLIISLYSFKILDYIFSQDEIIDIIKQIFKDYHINLDKLFHFAKRKKIFNEFYSFLLNTVDKEYLYHD